MPAYKYWLECKKCQKKIMKTNNKDLDVELKCARCKSVNKGVVS